MAMYCNAADLSCLLQDTACKQIVETEIRYLRCFKDSPHVRVDNLTNGHIADMKFRLKLSGSLGSKWNRAYDHNR